MKKTTLLFSLICFLALAGSALAQDQWVTDNEMKFKIKVPTSYSQNQMRDGTDKVLTIMSPDQNVFVRVRAMQATDQFTTDLLQQVFEQNIIQGAKRIMNEDGDLHGIPARASAYTWSVQGSDAVLATYYIIQNGFAYVVWAAVPQAQAQQYSAAADGIIDSFDLLKTSSGSLSGGLLGSLGSSGTPAGNNPTPPPAPATNPNPDYLVLVSDDACLEHLYPKNYKATSVEQGQSIWEDGSGIKMIVQTIFKQGAFRPYMAEMVSGIAGQGADVVKNQYISVNGLDVLQYSYTYGDTYFAYFAVESNDLYYLLGFVGDKLKQLKIVRYANEVARSVKKAPCGQQSGRNLDVVTAGGVKTATLTHHGFDFSTGQKGYADGETISWCPGGSNPDYPKGVWWRSSGNTQYKNLGNVPLSSVASVPATWDNPAVPLMVGNTYVIKCDDGYAAIKVLSVDAGANDWPVQVEYKFTMGSSF